MNVLQAKITKAKSIDSLEDLLSKYEKILHPNHYIQISIKNALIDFYGHMKGFSTFELSDELLSRKIELCKDVLSTLTIFEGSKSRARAFLMFELHETQVFYAMSCHEKGLILKEEYLNQILYARELLINCLEILEWEDENICIPLKLARASLKHIEKKLYKN